MKEKTKRYRPKYKYTNEDLELIYEELQQRAIDNPTLLILKQDTAHEVRSITRLSVLLVVLLYLNVLKMLLIFIQLVIKNLIIMLI